MKSSTAYVVYTTLMGVSIGCTSSGLVYFPYKNRAFVVSLLVAGAVTLVACMYVSVKYHHRRPDPSGKSTPAAGLMFRRPYLAMFIVWLVGMVFATFIRWAFMHSSI